MQRIKKILMWEVLPAIAPNYAFSRVLENTFLAHQIVVSAVFTHSSEINLEHPVRTSGRIFLSYPHTHDKFL